MPYRLIRLIAALALGLLLAPLAADAPPLAKMRTIGFLVPVSPSTAAHNLEAFRHGWHNLGWVEGQNIALDNRFNPGEDRLSNLAAEHVHLKVDVIVTWGTPAGLAAKQATTTIPIVSYSVDLVRTGLVASLARPGGNITGIATFASDLAGKRLELLKEVVPKTSHLLVLWNPENPGTAIDWRDTHVAAQALGVKLDPFEVRTVHELESTFAAITRAGGDALFVLHDLLVFDHRTRIVDFALKNRLPAMFALREYVDAGGLLSYGVNLPILWRRGALYVDKILKGAKPVDLPVEQPMKFELVINLKTAQALGLTLPPALLFQADEVIR